MEKEFTTTELYSHICEAILRCQGKIHLYPRGHPRVVETVRKIRDSLDEYFALTSGPFTVEALREDSASGDDPQRTRSGEARLVRHLKRHLIQQVVLRPGVTVDEIVDLCAALDQDPVRDGPEEDGAPSALRGSDHVGLLYFELLDTPVIPGPSSPLRSPARQSSRRAATGPRRARALLSEIEHAGAVCGTSDVEEKIAALRGYIEAVLPDGALPEGETLDVVEEFLKESMSDLDGSVDEETTRRSVLATLDALLMFLSKNQEFLSRELRSYGSDQASPDLPADFARSVIHGAGVSATVEAFQAAKDKLIALFRTARASKEGTEMAAAAGDGPSYGGDSARRPPKAREGEEDRPEATAEVLELLRETFANVDSFQHELVVFQEADYVRRQLRIVLELLANEELRDEVLPKWDNTRQLVLARSHGSTCRETILSELTSWLDTEAVREVDGTILDLLREIDDPETIQAWLETLSSTDRGRQIASSFLDETTTSSTEDAILLLGRIFDGAECPLREVARSRLFELSHYPGLFARWVTLYPRSLLRPGTIGEMSRHLGEDGLRRIFNRYFTQVSATDAAQLLSALPVNEDGVVEILQVAAERADPSIRELALRDLSRASPLASLSVLQQILRENNDAHEPCMQDVSVALRVLCGMDTPESRRYAERIASRRRWLRHEYRKEIRRELRKILEDSQHGRDS